MADLKAAKASKTEDGGEISRLKSRDSTQKLGQAINYKQILSVYITIRRSAQVHCAVSYSRGHRLTSYKMRKRGPNLESESLPAGYQQVALRLCNCSTKVIQHILPENTVRGDLGSKFDHDSSHASLQQQLLMNNSFYIHSFLVSESSRSTVY